MLMMLYYLRQPFHYAYAIIAITPLLLITPHYAALSCHLRIDLRHPTLLMPQRALPLMPDAYH